MARLKVGINDLASMDPELATEWHPTKNDGLTPQDVTPYSNKKVWWLGKCGHEWQTDVYHRSYGASCPYCTGQRVLTGFNDLATTNPSLATEWHPTKNDNLTPQDVSISSNKKVWWLGKCGHEWQTVIKTRSRGAGCPFCTGTKVLVGHNDLATKNPTLAAEWHPTKNENLTPQDVTLFSGKKVWWVGNCGHEWQALVSCRSLGSGCPQCAKKGRQRTKTIEYKIRN